MIGHFSEIVAILGGIKILTASLPYFYGSPVGYLALMIVLGIMIGIWILILRFTESQDEYGAVQANPVMRTIAPAAAILLVGTPIAVQWNTFATAAQTKHLECQVFSPGSSSQCFAAWVKRSQKAS